MDQLEYPTSLSGYLYDEKNEPIRIDKGLKKVGEVESSKRFWSLLYGQAQLSDQMALFADFNAKVKNSGGIAVVNLQVENSACILNHFFVLNLLPFWPGCTVIELKGDAVVKDR